MPNFIVKTQKGNMKKILLFSPLLIALQSCTTTFAGSLFFFTFGDMVLYVVIALALAFIISLLSTNRKRSFWLAFALGVLLTPLASLIYLLIIVTRKKKPGK
jgi:hypothetical protein